MNEELGAALIAAGASGWLGRCRCIRVESESLAASRCPPRGNGTKLLGQAPRGLWQSSAQIGEVVGLFQGQEVKNPPGQGLEMWSRVLPARPGTPKLPYSSYVW